MLPPKGSPYLYAEIAATADATLTLTDAKTGTRYDFDLRPAVDGKELQAKVGASRVQIIERERVKLSGTVLDAATHQPTPVRLAFRSKEGRYIPPYGHRCEINDAWFEDYGADIKLMDSPFAYVGGEFEVELGRRSLCRNDQRLRVLASPQEVEHRGGTAGSHN